MHVHMLLSFALMGAPESETGAPLAQLQSAAWTEQQLTAEYRSVIQRVRKYSTFDANRDVNSLVLLHGILSGQPPLSRTDRVRMRRTTEYWLEKSLERLRRERARNGWTRRSYQARSKHRPANRTKSADPQPDHLAGGAANAQALIDLIEQTIQPETWDSNGGAGTIRYYSPLHLLVVRNNQQVHHELGGMLRVLENAR